MKNVIVTGASGNMGQAVVKKFLSEGFHVVGTIIPNDPGGIEINGQHFETAIVDLMDETAAKVGHCISVVWPEPGWCMRQAER
jgi:NAD(P)-dependent dehydrogenase (short-subunit alcohol dehydrogenase family)